jgi:hypothetical protein
MLLLLLLLLLPYVCSSCLLALRKRVCVCVAEHAFVCLDVNARA